MNVAGKVAIVTGGGGGIGAAIAEMLSREGALAVLVDLDADAVSAASATINARRPNTTRAVTADVTDPAEIRRTIEYAETEFGPVDMYFANAGITGAPGLDASESDWDLAIDVNLRAHIRAAQILVPQWLERGSGYFVSTASAAGLLTQIGMAAYSATKHAAVGFAEWLAVTYGDNGIGVSCLCPMGVETNLLRSGAESGDRRSAVATRAVVSAGAVLQPAEIAESLLEAITEGRFLVLPHAQVLDMYRQKGEDYDRWLRGMQHYQSRLMNAE